MTSSLRGPTHFVGPRNLHVHPAYKKMQIPRSARNDDVQGGIHQTEKRHKSEGKNRMTERSRMSLGVLRVVPLAVLVLFLAGVRGSVQTGAASPPRAPRKKLYNPPYPNNPVKPFRIMGNIYYVGLTNYTSFLITTPKGLILLDTEDKQFVPNIRENIEALGFHLKDIKILLQTHAHVDHVGGLAALQEQTGAKVLVMAEDESVLADGGKSDFRNDGRELWKPVRADKTLRDGEKVELGGVTMVAHLTPGHTKGCTTWTTVAAEKGRKYHVVFICSNRLNDGVPLIGNKKYPNIADAYASGFKKLKTLPCDVFLASHAYMFNMDEKLKRMQEGAQQNPFIDPQGCKEYVADYENEFLYQLDQERAGGPSSGATAK
jgi:metallo-beta-lactamase class B